MKIHSGAGTRLGRRPLREEIAGLKARLRKCDSRLRVLEMTPRTIFWEMDMATWRFTYVGPQAERILGYQAEDWFEPNFWIDRLHPEDRGEAVRYCQECTERLEDYEFQYRMIAADGRIVWIGDIVTVVHDGKTPSMLSGVMIDVTEQQEEGAKFRVYLPNAVPDKDDAQLSSKLAASNCIKVLVIDDDELFGELICRVLKKVGFGAVVTTDPEAAFRRVRKNPEEFNVIITDLLMPKKSGLDLAAAIRKVRPEVPIILLTGNESFIRTNGGIYDDVSLCLSKPINIKVLAEAVRDVAAAVSC